MDRIDNAIFAELRAFPGITKTMLNSRLRSRFAEYHTYRGRVNELIEDGHITIRWKHVEGVKRPALVLFLANDDSIVSAPGLQAYHNDDADLF